MADNRSLDEFLGAEESGEPGSGADTSAPPDAPASAEADPDQSVDDAADEGATEEALGGGDPAGGAATEEAVGGEEPAVDGSEADAAEETTPAAVEPMAETFAWSAGGGECAACGAAVEERWRDGDGLVCGDCKAW